MPTSNTSTRIRLSVDDGCASDVSVAKLAKRYKIETTFYWPVNWTLLAYSKGYEPLSYVDARIIATKHEIGGHGISHEHLTKLTNKQAHEEIFYSGVMLNKLFDTHITKFAPSRGYTNKELTSFTYKFYKQQRLTKGVDDDGYKLVHVHPDSGANDNKPWKDCIDSDKVHLWMHGQELDRFSLWDELEAVLAAD